jgi:beta-lactamase superfamily II metal-dependent hydrolase
MRNCLLAVAVLGFGLVPFRAEAENPERGLDIYFVDTEGGAATLLVSPQGESTLIDCGNPGTRDPDRIHKVATEQANLKALDNLIITHWHTDHYGGADRLAQLIPIHHFYDRGIPPNLAEDPGYPLLMQAYKKASKEQSKTLSAGDEIPLKQLEGGPRFSILTLCARGEVMPDKPGAPENPVAGEHKPQPVDPTDNAKSLGFLIRYGDFRFLDLGDLTWNIEYKLVHPTDKIGPIDVYQSTHHGLEISNNPVVIKTVQPRVAIFNNGPRKGGHPSVIATLRHLPHLEAIYQVHFNVLATPEENTDPQLIANHEENCAGEFIKLAVAPDGKSYTVTVGAKGKPRRFATRSKES